MTLQGGMGTPDTSAGGVQSVVAGTNITVDDTDPANPVVSATGSGGGGIASVVAGTDITVDDTDPDNPIVGVTAGSFDADGAAAAVLATSLQKASNLSDLANASTSRTNLGLGTAAVADTTDFDASGAAAAVLATSLQKASNLSDLASASTARTNLGLGTAAVATVGTATGNVAALNGSSSNVLHGNGSWSDPSAGALTYQQASLSSSFSGSTTLATYQTITLGIGTWLINVSVEVNISGTNIGVAIKATPGTSSPTLSGVLASSVKPTATTEHSNIALTFIAVVTVANSTVLLQEVGSDIAFINASTVQGSYPNASGYTAVKIA